MHFKAIYNDETYFGWDEDVPGQNAFNRIDHERLKVFEIYEGDKLFHRLHLEPGRKLIYARRTIQNTARGILDVIYLAGYHENTTGENIQFVLALFSDGHTELFGKWRDAPLHEINHPKTKVEAEKAK